MVGDVGAFGIVIMAMQMVLVLELVSTFGLLAVRVTQGNLVGEAMDFAAFQIRDGSAG